ncbi:hypothetical protein FKW77_000332 [Venturia effusa]|uniref:DUF7871 domain-containing protein n=1 Tax=Venturia effusa TaxID=50376 RepID=A0A517LHV8_9PEZI|nr:hypothetical protein FKW77_000332 [Venturia effusa]
MTSVAPKNCCGRSTGGDCVCAAEAKCSCGKQSALHCTCEKASTENVVPANPCACGQRAADACTCGRASEGTTSANEIDFTTK